VKKPFAFTICLVAASVLLLVLFQNISQDSPVGKKFVKPLQLAQAATEAPNLTCDPDSAYVLYVRFPGTSPGTKISGTISDTEGKIHVPINLTIGQDSVIGNCATDTFNVAGAVKICLDEPMGPYFTFQMNILDAYGNKLSSFTNHEPAALHCEDSANWPAIALQPESK
jgi:hypothetical protein